MKRLLLLSTILGLSCLGLSQTLLIKPYLGHAEPDHIHISWVTDSNAQSLVEWGATNALGSSTNGTSFTTAFGDEIHEVELNGLTPDTKYFYRAITGGVTTEIYELQTPPLASAEQSFNMVAMSDMQRDAGNPTIFSQIVNDGVIPVVAEQYGEDIPAKLGFVIVPGDLVVNGLDYNSWQDEFFNPAEALFSEVPVYPVLGNHEVNTPYYFDFFHLPENGTAGFEERWYYKDYSNVRIIGLDSNSPFNGATQLNWLQSVLDDACVDPAIDFVFAQLHHPHHSELWLPGESSFTTDVVGKLETFSTACGKPSIHFFGHTHGYSRGQSHDHSHLMVNVATAGGNIDYWGEFAQFDYPEFTVSHSEWGFVMLEVDAGPDPQFKLKRYSIGSEFLPLQNELRDSITVKRNNIPPNQPVAISPVNEVVDPNCLLLIGSTYADTDNDIHMASQWQISTDPGDFSLPIYDEFRTHENWYYNVDTQAGEILVDELVSGIPSNSTLYWRVKYRDHSLGWSTWSSPVEFTTSTGSESANLVVNPGAENAISNWTVTLGVLESLVAFDCAGTSPYSGTYYFGIGGLCVESAVGEAHQLIDLSAFQTDIDAGTQFARYGAAMSDWAGDDVPEVWVEFLDGTLNVLGTSPSLTGAHAGWQIHEDLIPIPVSTDYARIYMRGTRNGGVDNDSYVDDIFFHVSSGAPCDESAFDEDNDGVIDSIDNCLGLVNSDQADFDDDGVGDACEDSDGDGISDEDEITIYMTDPSEPDSDFDGLSDFDEIFTSGSNPLIQDSDGDGLTDELEVNESFTDPMNPDTDGDGCDDNLEYHLECPDNLCNDCPSDLNGDGVVNASDLLIFLGAFATICP